MVSPTPCIEHWWCLGHEDELSQPKNLTVTSQVSELICHYLLHAWWWLPLWRSDVTDELNQIEHCSLSRMQKYNICDNGYSHVFQIEQHVEWGWIISIHFVRTAGLNQPPDQFSISWFLSKELPWKCFEMPSKWLNHPANSFPPTHLIREQQTCTLSGKCSRAYWDL